MIIQHNPMLEHEVLKMLPILRDYTVLELGCGLGDWGHLLMSRKDLRLIDGIDIQIEPSLYRLGYKDLIYMDLDEGPLTFMQAYDYIIAFEVLEHLKSKEHAIEVIEHFNRLAREKFLISVPNRQKGLPNSEHNISWNRRDFNSLGFQTLLVPNQRFYLPRFLKPFEWIRQNIFVRFNYGSKVEYTHNILAYS